MKRVYKDRKETTHGEIGERTYIKIYINQILLGSKELGTNVLELYFVMLANHDQKILVLFRLAQSICFYVKLESSDCRIYCVNLPSSIDRKLDSIDQRSCRFFFSAEFSNSAQAYLMCRVLCFVLSIMLCV